VYAPVRVGRRHPLPSRVYHNEIPGGQLSQPAGSRRLPPGLATGRWRLKANRRNGANGWGGGEVTPVIRRSRRGIVAIRNRGTGVDIDEFAKKTQGPYDIPDSVVGHARCCERGPPRLGGRSLRSKVATRARASQTRKALVGA